ncbi:biotin--[acetyl-CoA-carboxylase] ligase [uncultured Oscillibacter sp.]|jgi:BirA family biotin operon repressor/biotin-[acetyl-CoA-carboxylase] ligase|uniref:biotin--[acetyl-CoA-carboxylase] ligase n=1 Tax=uncultured Oscillibacter sp. TaxID=876091 RepID=UPI0025FFEA44|nr:biotin--[acetyl-CoA-carboxylase] ligase [uncultured Oscillibacter sp.]
MSSREAVLSLLRNEGAFLSGEEISRRLGLSRTAVWKAVDVLRREGYEIEARTGLGYRLTAVPDALTEAEIRSFLGETAVVGRELRCFAELDSTNNYLKTQTAAPDGTAAVADSQTAGRGRMDRSFQSPKGRGIYLSVLLRPPLPPERLLPVTALAGVAVCAAVERVCGVRPGLKWPNDPVLNGKKLCGILTEMSLEAETGRVQSLVLGIGVNVGQGPEDFSPEVREMATSLLQALGQPVSRPRLTAALLEELDRAYAALLAGDLSAYLAAYRRDCVNLGKTVQLIPFGGGERETAQAVDVDGEFSLVIRGSGGGERTVRSGEVSVRGLWGYAD